MALVPNFWTDTTIEIPREGQDDWTELLKSVSIRSGFYQAPNQGSTKGRSAAGDDSILLEQRKSITNQYGWELRRDEEAWSYDIVNGPPQSYERTTSSRAYLPGLGRNFRKVEEEKTDYFTFSPLTDGDNLGRIRRISAYVVYTLPLDPTKAASGESKTNASDAGVVPGNTEDRIVSTGKLWSEATRDGTVVPDESAPQWTKWVENVVEEHDIVEEMTDRWVVWTIKKNALRPGHVEVSGPRDIKKTGFVYQFPFPIEPPVIKLVNANNGVKIEVDGGGAHWTTPWFRQEMSIPADKYNIYRKKISEPARSPDDNLGDWWKTPPTAEGPRSIITNTDTTDYAGSYSDPVPPAGSWTEPGDVDEPEEGSETSFSLIATVDNTSIYRRHDRGHGEHLDEDIVDTAVYEYYATALIADSESPDSNHEQTTATRDNHQRIVVRPFDDGRGADAIVPDDPNLPDDDFGEIEEFEIPTEDIEDVIDDIVTRQFAQNDPAFQINLDVLMPLLGLEYGQTVETPVIQWDAYGNDLHMETETDGEEWILVGFTLSVTKNKDLSWTTQKTKLALQERTP